MQRKMWWLVFSCLVALVLASCGPAVVEEEEGKTIVGKVTEKEEAVVEEEEVVVVETKKGPQYGGQITFASGLGLRVWGLAQQGQPLEALSFVLERLGTGDWSRGPAGTNEYSYIYKYVPGEYRIGSLAESWEQPEPYVFIFHIRQGIHWQNKSPVNGREVTADDVVFSFNKCLEYPRSETKWWRDNITSVKALDKYTVEFRVFEGSYASFGSFGWSYIYVTPIEIPEWYELDFDDWRSMCGTGPYMVVDYVTDSSVLYERNPNYWKYDEVNPENRLPYADRIKILVLPDRTTRLAALRTGKVDFMDHISPEEAKSLMKTNPELKYTSDIVDTASPGIGWKLDAGHFSDIRVRKAMSMAIDRETILRDYLGGEGITVSWPQCAGWGETVWTPIEKMPQEIREIYEYNPEKAKQLLAEAGYPDGFKTNLITVNELMERVQILQAYWKDIGIDVEIRPMEYGSMWGILLGRKIEALYAAWWGQGDPVGVLSYLVSDSYYNLGNVSDPYYDDQYRKILEAVDEVERDRLCKELDLYYKANVYALSFPAEVMYIFWQPWLGNYHGEQLLGFFWDPGPVWARVWIDQDMKRAMGKGK